MSVTDYDNLDAKQQPVGYDALDDLIRRDLDSTGEVDQRLLWGSAVDQILADENGSGDVYWMLTDHQNTVRDVVEYNDIGPRKQQAGTTTPDPFSYSIRFFDSPWRQA